MDKKEGEINTSREVEHTTSVLEDGTVVRKKKEKGWNIAPKYIYVRVTITNDQVDQGKLFILISTPFQPDYLVMNYLPFEVKI